MKSMSRRDFLKYSETGLAGLGRGNAFSDVDPEEGACLQRRLEIRGHVRYPVETRISQQR